MAVDEKYGVVTLEFGNIGETEPVVVLRAQNGLLLGLLDLYYELCRDSRGSDRNLYLIRKIQRTITRWQADPKNYVRTP